MKVTLTVEDLFDIRSLAQQYLKQGIFRYPKGAVQGARRAVIKMKRYFNGGNTTKTKTTKRRVETKSGKKANN